ncbi:MAG: hypothetical protein LUQ24_00780 [Methanobacterium sp.]|nr:hypothetical protein [Methanobacterium sp.]
MYKNKYSSYLLLIPAVIAFLLALYPTLTNGWPLSFDIFWHVHVAKIYSTYGLVFIDPGIDPVSQSFFIYYPPLFHLALATFGNLLNIDYFQLVRFLQPFVAFSLILSVTLVSKKFYGLLAGFSAGILLLSSLLFGRFLLTLPENFALIFLLFAVYFLYLVMHDRNYKYLAVVGLLLVLIASTHLGALLSTVIIFASFLIIGFKKYVSIFNHHRKLVALLLLVIGIIIALLLIFKLQSINYVLQNWLTTIGTLLITVDVRPISFLGYLRNIGLLVLVFGLVGFVLALAKRRVKDLMLILWVLSMFLLSLSYLAGLNVISYRILIYLILPLSILGGCGVSYIYHKLRQGNLFKNRNYIPQIDKKHKASLFLIIIIILSVFQGILTVTSQDIVEFDLKTDWGLVKIAPPTNSEIEVSNWFKQNGNRSKVVLTNNYYLGMFLTATTDQPFDYKDFHLLGYQTDHKPVFIEKRIGYILYDKTLKYISHNETAVHWVNNVIYYNDSNLIIPSYARIVFENENYTVVELVLD